MVTLADKSIMLLLLLLLLLGGNDPSWKRGQITCGPFLMVAESFI